MNQFMTADHPDAFLDFEKLQPERDLTKECPVCKGHGGWNLRVNAYPLHNYEDTPKNRHNNCHFICGCPHCNGWGYVREDEMCNGHEWEFFESLGHCLRKYKCKHCGEFWIVDSSD